MVLRMIPILIAAYHVTLIVYAQVLINVMVVRKGTEWTIKDIVPCVLQVMESLEMIAFYADLDVHALRVGLALDA